MSNNKTDITASEVSQWLNQNKDKIAFVETGRTTSELKECVYDISEDALLILTKPVKP